MRTDWVLVRRIAFELRSRLKGARFQDAVLLSDGRPALEFWSSGAPVWLCIDLFGSPPIVALEAQPAPAADAPGFARVLARSLRGSVVCGIESRERDRLLRMTFCTRSRFGVTDEWDLFIELTPRFGNAVLIKSDTIVSAFKEFAGAIGGRAVRAGLPYELPPLPAHPPCLIDDARIPIDGPVFVYRKNGALLQAHLAQLPAFADAQCEQADSLLDVLAEERAQRSSGGVASENARRAPIVRRIERDLARSHEALRVLEARVSDARAAGELQREGTAIYATLYELDASAQREAKERAASLFAKAKKLSAGAAHVERRRAAMEARRDALEMLAWEAQRVGDDDLTDVENAFAALDRRRQSSQAPKRSKSKRRALLEVRTAAGSRILVGRSPSENAELTFGIARPNDLWFHVRGAPGAHVVLARGEGTPPDVDIELAAALAAGRSKAQGSAKVTVDYALRKHVRKRPGAAPGLVYYTHATSIVVAPLADPAQTTAASATRRHPSRRSS